MNGNRYCEAAIVCGGNINDPGFCLYLANVKRDLQKILHADRDELQIQKVERWNSVRVTFRLPHNAVQRLRVLAEKNPEALRSLGILSVQVDGIVTRNAAAATSTAAASIDASASTSNNSVVVSSLNSTVNNNNNNFNNSSTSSVYNNSINNTSTAAVQQNVSSLVNANSFNAVVDSGTVVRRTVAGIIRHTAPTPQQQHQFLNQGQAPTTSNCYPANPPAHQQQQQPAAIYANYQQHTTSFGQQAQSTPAPPSHHQQQQQPRPPTQQRARINSAAHCGTNIVNTSLSSNVAGGGPPNSSPLLVNLLQQHSPPPSTAAPVGQSTMVVQQQLQSTASSSMVNEQPPPAKKRKKPTKKQTAAAQQQAAAATTASTSAAYCGVSGGCHSDVQVTNYSSQGNLVLAPPPHHHQQQPAHHQQQHPPSFHPSASTPSSATSANQMRHQPSSVYSNFIADGDSQVVVAHHSVPSRADRDATISSAIDSVVSRVSMPSMDTPADAQVQQQQQQQNIQHHWINDEKVIGHSGHVDGAVSDLSNVHQSSATMFDAGMSPAVVPTHHPLHTNRITTPTNHVPESQQHHQQPQQSASAYYGSVVVDPSSSYLHHMAPPQPPSTPHLPSSSSSTSSSSPWSQQPLQHQFLQQQAQVQQSGFSVRPPCSLPIQAGQPPTAIPQQSSSTPASHLHQHQMQQQQQDLHHASNVWLSPPPSYSAVCHVANLAVHSQTKVNNPTTSSLVNGDDPNVVVGGGLGVWRHHDAGGASSNDVAAVLNCHDSEHRWIEQQQSDHDYLSDGYHPIHHQQLHQQQQNLMNSSPGDYVLHTATATASAVVTSGATPNALFKSTNNPTIINNPGGQWNSFNIQNTEVQDTFNIHDNGGGGDIHSTSVVGRPPSQWHTMPSFDGAKTVGLRTSAPNANSPVLPPENMIRFSPG